MGDVKVLQSMIFASYADFVTHGNLRCHWLEPSAVCYVTSSHCLLLKSYLVATFAQTFFVLHTLTPVT